MSEPASPTAPAAAPSPPAPRPRPPVPRPRPRRVLALTLAHAALTALLTVLLVALLLDGRLRHSDTIGEVHRQPASVTYSDGFAHYVGLIHVRGGIFGGHRSYELYAGPTATLDHGHRMDLDYGDKPVIKSVSWDDKGVRVAFASGHEVFVPARSFVGGR